MRRRRRGAHAIALTPEGRVVLVKLTYARGWRLPGGGVDPGEDDRAAALRELREEIGMVSHGSVRRLDHPGLGGDGALFVVTDVIRRWRPSLEIRRVGTFDPTRPPSGLAEVARRMLDVHLDDVGRHCDR